MIESDYMKVFGFFVPFQFKETDALSHAEKFLCFYYINDNQLVTVSNKQIPKFISNNEKLISLDGAMHIYNDRWD